jgi:hypothetical protein
MILFDWFPISVVLLIFAALSIAFVLSIRRTNHIQRLEADAREAHLACLQAKRDGNEEEADRWLRYAVICVKKLGKELYP